jgi:putative PIN family toxin of toxin-antitoxin system
MRLVLDTNVVVAAMRSPSGASAEILRLLRRGQGTLILSTPLVLEYEATCQRAEHRLVSGLGAREVGLLLDGLVFLAEPVEAHFRWRPQLRDAADEMVLETAVNGRADAIVTFNRSDFGEAPKPFGIEVFEPSEIVRRLRT